MRNIKLTIEYDGTNYCGWQVQRKQKTDNRRQKKTIQQTLEQALARLLQEKVKLIASGRTDSGVHALGQTANFKTNSKLTCRNVQQGLNSLLPYDIRIKQAEEVDPDFHARFSAQSKLYRYTIVNAAFVSPFLRNFSLLVKYPLSLSKMRQGAVYLLGRHNFKSFQAADKKIACSNNLNVQFSQWYRLHTVLYHKKKTGSVRTIRRLEIRSSKSTIYFDLEADGFLYRMVRNIVGTLVDIGRGKLKAEDVQRILRAKNRIYAGYCAPAKGLCLVEVKYRVKRKSR